MWLYVSSFRVCVCVCVCVCVGTYLVETMSNQIYANKKKGNKRYKTSKN